MAELRFQKPPVVEVWISVDFDPDVKKTEWNLELVQAFIDEHKAEFSRIEAIREQQFHVEEAPKALPRIIGQTVELRFVRMSNEGPTKVLQIGDDKLSFHSLKSDSGFPGYAAVREQMQQKLESYAKLFRPTRIRDAALHYLDIIEIPQPESRQIELRDYFTIASDVPEKPFGLMTGFNYKFQIDCPVDRGPLILHLQLLPSPPEQKILRFRMDWHKESVAVNTLELAKVWARLDIAHDYMRDCFRSALMPRTLDLFEPIPETK